MKAVNARVAVLRGMALRLLPQPLGTWRPSPLPCQCPQTLSAPPGTSAAPPPPAAAMPRHPVDTDGRGAWPPSTAGQGALGWLSSSLPSSAAFSLSQPADHRQCHANHYLTAVTSHSDLSLHQMMSRRHAHGQSSAPADGPPSIRGAGQQQGPDDQQQQAGQTPADVLYKGKGIRLLRLLVRMKVAQLTGIAAAAVPLTTYASQGSVPLQQLVVCTGLLTGAGVVSAAVWYYTSRYIGELSALPGGSRLKFSTMDFWGHRSDAIADVRDVVPPLQGLSQEALKVMAERPLIPVNVTGDRQYFISLRHGHLEDRQRLFSLLDGSWGSRVHQEAEAQWQAAQESQPQNKRPLPAIGGGGMRRIP